MSNPQNNPRYNLVRNLPDSLLGSQAHSPFLNQRVSLLCSPVVNHFDALLVNLRHNPELSHQCNRLNNRKLYLHCSHHCSLSAFQVSNLLFNPKPNLLQYLHVNRQVNLRVNLRNSHHCNRLNILPVSPLSVQLLCRRRSLPTNQICDLQINHPNYRPYNHIRFRLLNRSCILVRSHRLYPLCSQD